MAQILAIGIATLDIVNTVSAYPAEDAEVRASSQRRARGGNATNTLVVLSQLGHQCEWAGVLVDEPDSAVIRAELKQYRIGTGSCRYQPHGKMPTSYVTLSEASGSRTIVHFRDLPEYGLDDLRAVALDNLDWVHFEGRDVQTTAAMLAHVRAQHPQLPISVEIEKPRPDIEHLSRHADLVLTSRAFARARGYGDAQELFATLRRVNPDAVLACGWGEEGAYGLSKNDEFVHAPACPPARVRDTLGAGDTFNAAMIDAALRGLPLSRQLQAACRLAGRKCGQIGLAGLGDS